MQKLDSIKHLKFNTENQTVQAPEAMKNEVQIFETGNVLQGDMLMFQEGKSDWTSALTEEYNKLGLKSYDWKVINGVDDAVAKSANNFIDLIRYYEGHGDNYTAKTNYKDTVNVSTYGYGLTTTAMKAIGNYKNGQVINKPNTQTKAYEQLLKYLNDITLPETKRYLGDVKYDELPQGVKAALLDYHFKNGSAIMNKSSLKSKLQETRKTNTPENWVAVLNELVYAKPASSKADKADNPGLYRRSLSRVILAAKDLKNYFPSPRDRAMIDKTVKEIYEAGVKCAKDNNIGTADFDRIYNNYIAGNTSIQAGTAKTSSNNVGENKYVVPSQMGLFSAANAIIPEKAAEKNGIDSKELRIAVINEIMRLNNIQSDGVDENNYPKIRLLEQDEQLIMPALVKVGKKTISLNTPDNWEAVNTETQSQQVTQTLQLPDSDNDEDMNKESVRIIDLLNKECPSPTFSNIGTDNNLQCATYRYKVQQGDTIYRLALRYGVDWKTMLADNNMTEKSILEIDTEIKINKIIYTVKNGDNLTQIAKRYGLTVDYMRDVNGIEDADKLDVGQKLEFPGYIYTVKKGDNLIQISKKVGVDVAELGKLNGLESPYTLQTGQKLLILFNDSSYNVSDSNKVTSIDDEGNTVTTIKSDNAMLTGRPYLHKEMVNGRCVANRHVFKPTKTGPLNNKTIIVNAGHGYMPGGSMDNGAPGLKGYNDEVFVNYDNAMRLIKKLQDKGATVIYLQGYEGKSKKNLDLISQELEKSKNKANLFISVHANSSEVPPAVDRAEIYYHRDSNSAHGKKLAGIFEKKLDNYQGKENYAETKSCGYQVLRTAKSKGTPAILWEVAYINNKTGSQRLNNSSLMEKYTELLADSVVEYFSKNTATSASKATQEKQSLNSTYVTHKVKKGDSLINIAKKYGVTIEQIKKLNGLKNNNIQIGQNLKIKKK